MTSPLRVLLVQTQAENAGAQEIARILGRGLKAKGHDISNLFFFRKSSTFSEQPNTFYCAPNRPASLPQLARLLWNLALHIRRMRPDVILTFQHYGNTIATPIAKLVTSAPVIANQVSALQTMNWPVRTVDLVLGMTGMFRAITVNSIDVARMYKTYPVSYRDRIVHVAHGFAERTSRLTRVQARESFQLPNGSVLLGCVARLHPLKGLDNAIRMLKSQPDWHLALLGQGAEEAPLKQLASELGVSTRVHFVGEVDPDRIGDFLATLDVFVFPSRAETFGLAAVEAAQAGVPVVANDLPVLREVLAFENKPAAQFVDAGNVDELARAVSLVLHDQQLRASLQENGRHLKSLYSIDRMVEDYERIIARLVQSPAGNALEHLRT
jgi:glycosyltransferase involved in cell wall biosynthesis